MREISMVNYLVKVSNGNIMINFLNHIVFLLCLISCFYLWKKSKHRQAFLISQLVVLLLIISVISNAIYYGNPFHLFTFTLLIVCILLFQAKGKAWECSHKEYSVKCMDVVPAISILLGIWYPEFTNVTVIKSILFSPLGIVPCPTLLLLLGFMCLFKEYFCKKSIYILILFAFIYGIIGTFVFHVYFDICLLVEASFSIVYINKWDRCIR